MKTTSEFSTGWFGIPGGPESASTKVHVVDANAKPICGARIGAHQRYQWCSHGAWLEGVECKRCKCFANRIAMKGGTL